MTQIRRRFMIGLVAFVALAIPVAKAQTSGTSAKKQVKFYWCWAAQLRSDANNQTKVWYSAVFSGDYPIAGVKSAFRTNIDKDYHGDVMATGVGPGECGSYGSRAAAESSKNQNVTWRRDDNGMQIVETGWSYGSDAPASAKKVIFCWSLGHHTQFFSDLFSAAFNDNLELTYRKEFLAFLQRKYPEAYSGMFPDVPLSVTYCDAFESKTGGLAFIESQRHPNNNEVVDTSWIPASGLK